MSNKNKLQEGNGNSLAITLRTPQENPEGYDNNSPINHVDKLKGNFLLVHGSGDDNVHYQNTMDMITALVAANKQFDLYIYPNKNHGIYGGNTRRHLYDKMTEFLFIYYYLSDYFFKTLALFPTKSSFFLAKPLDK